MTRTDGATSRPTERTDDGIPTVFDVLQDLFRELEGDPIVSVNVVKASKLASEGKSLLLYGESGRGKTWCVGSLPEELTLILDFDRGIETLSQTSHHVVRPESYEELMEVYRGLVDGSLKYRFVALDSLSELEKAIQAERKRVKSKPFASLKEFGETAEMMRQTVRQFRDLRAHGITTVFTCLEMPLDIELGDAQVITKHVPLVGRKFALELCGLVDMVGRLLINPDTRERELHFNGCQEFIAKTRVHAVDAIEPPDLTALFRKIYGIKAADGEASPKDEKPSGKPGKAGKANGKSE